MAELFPRVRKFLEAVVRAQSVEQIQNLERTQWLPEAISATFISFRSLPKESTSQADREAWHALLDVIVYLHIGRYLPAQWSALLYGPFLKAKGHHMGLVYAACPPAEKNAEARQASMMPYHVVFAMAYRGLDHRPLSLTVFVLAAAYCSLYLPQSNLLKELDPRARCDAAFHILQIVEKAPKEQISEAEMKQMTTLRRLGGHVLSDIIMTDGLGTLLLCIFAEDTDEKADSARAKARQVAFVLAQKPRLLKKEVYFVALTKQMWSLLSDSLCPLEGSRLSSVMRVHMFSVLVQLVQLLELEYPEYLQYYFTTSMLRPLMMLFATRESLPSHAMLASSEVLALSLDTLHAICTHADTPSHVIMSFIMVLPSVMQMCLFCEERKRPYDLALAILQAFVKHIDATMLAGIFEAQTSTTLSLGTSSVEQTGMFAIDKLGFLYIKKKDARKGTTSEQQRLQAWLKVISRVASDALIQATFTRLLEEHIQTDWAAAIDLEQMFHRFEMLTYLADNHMASLIRSWQGVVHLLTQIFEMEHPQDELTSLALELGASLLDGVDVDTVNLSDTDRTRLNGLVGSLTLLRSHQADGAVITPAIDSLKLSALSLLGVAQRSEKNDDTTDVKHQEHLREILKQLKDEVLPLRAMGLHGIKQLCRTEPAFAKTQLRTLLPLVLLHLNEQDSFIHLNAVQTLSAMLTLDVTTMLPDVMATYLDQVGADASTQKLDEAGRVRLGEALIQFIQRFGEANAQHVDMILNPLLAAIPQQSINMISTSLSLIAALYVTAPLALWRWDHDTIDICLSLLRAKKTDASPSNPAFWASAEEERQKAYEDHEAKVAAFEKKQERNEKKKEEKKTDDSLLALDAKLASLDVEDEDNVAPTFKEPPTPSNQPVDNRDRACVYLLLCMVQSISQDGDVGKPLIDRFGQSALRETAVLLRYIQHQQMIQANDAILQQQIETTLAVIDDALKGLLVQFVA